MFTKKPGDARDLRPPRQFFRRQPAVRLLLIEDHKPLVRALKKGLEEEGFAVDVAYDGEEGDYKGRSAQYDVVILDLMLPKEDGLSLLQRWRRQGVKTHVLVLTARGTIEDKVRGLNLGADDYLTKPFQLDELLARLRALVRREHQEGSGPASLRSRNRHGGAFRQARGTAYPSHAARIRLAAIPCISPRQSGLALDDLEPPL